MACPYLLIVVTGIRSQSKPNDIMGEVYRAMVTLGYVSKLENFISFLTNCRHNQFFFIVVAGVENNQSFQSKSASSKQDHWKICKYFYTIRA